MALGFLCDMHREQLSSRPSLAVSIWDKWIQKGCECFKARDWRRALNYLGCSFELSELMLERGHDGDRDGELRRIDRFMVSGHFLAECFARCDRVDMERHCLLKVHHRLLTDMRARPATGLSLKTNLEISLHMLERHFSAHDEFALLAKCYNEGMLTLQAITH